MKGRRFLGTVAAVLVIAACADPEGVAEPPRESSTTTQQPDAAATTADPSPVVETSEAATTEPPAPIGPQACGTVTSVIGEELTVEIVTGDVACPFAEDLLDTYYNDPPSPPEGSGGYVTIDDWECNSSSSQEPGHASTCHGPDNAVVVTLVSGAEPGERSEGGEGPIGPICSQIDDPTLEQLFPDGEFDEALCQSYIDGENSIG
ncbi:hypothetical protein [Georgenia halophila]